MKIIKTQLELSGYLESFRNNKFKIGLVPTMGALHNGHLSLIEQSKLACDLTVVSIFVNPTQFNNSDDLLKYPKPIVEDTKMLVQAGCDVLFLPEVSEMYHNHEEWNYGVGALDKILEGEFRPGHYKGVTQIVFKLFDLVKPTRAFFGQKDYQQFLVIKKMNDDLNLGIALVACPIIREPDGLAMSSRNIRLNDLEREKALTLYQSLLFVKENYHRYSLSELLEKAIGYYQNDEDLKLEYFKICDQNTLLDKQINDNESAIALVACMVGKTRLIDNMMLS
ncbi:pantoate--beta-alanine ligase [Pedobacter cryophilus]|uniref:Pantothenate synthetase n=1 Tax=Pedobacter cryophilus TaxID=2571271 RepID=A0A4V5NY24_9SPHI|nr:pantoate--beta-alanine ligase [Pedobacter cryophilus]TKC00611.1 pantoate--beta-alanine ligase [Pedobacter cryophilus]